MEEGVPFRVLAEFGRLRLRDDVVRREGRLTGRVAGDQCPDEGDQGGGAETALRSADVVNH